MSENRATTKPATLEQAINAINRYAVLQTRQRIKEAKRDKRIQEIQEEYAPDLAQIETQMEAYMLIAATYAEGNREKLFPDGKKSDETELAEYGFRFGKSALALIEVDDTWDKALARIKESELYHAFVRKTEDVDKEGIKKAVTAKKLAKDPKKLKELQDELERIGLRIERAEKFFIDPKVDGGSADSTPVDPE